MSSKIIKKILSLMLCFVLLLTSFTYADTVVIGAAPNSTDKTLSQSATTTFLQNQYTGPGTMPSSSNMLGSSPIQMGGGVTLDQASTLGGVDSNGVADAGPTVKTITSPAAHNAELATTTGNTNVITNGAEYFGSKSSSTSDTGPTVKEITAPKAGGESINNASGTIINGQLLEPGSAIGNENPTNGAAIPSYVTVGGTVTTGDTAAYSTDTIIYQVNNNIQAAKPAVTAPSAIAVNATTRQIYFSKDGFGKYPPAALANLVTATILLSYKGLDDVLSVSASAVSGLESGASTAGLYAGDTITVRDALGAMFVKSCCDVSNVVAENVGGSIPNFVAMMNQTVKNWGCIGTNFANPTGLNNDAQLTNVYDMAIIMDKATQNPNIKIMLGLSSYKLPATSHRGAVTIYSKNTLLTPGSSMHYDGIGASRMGYTSKAKYTMASEIDYNGQRLIVVVLKANGSQFTDTTRLLNFAKVACIEAGGVNAAAVQQAGATQQQAVTTGSNAGDTAGVWQQDNNGWYFIKANGNRANNEWIKQNGKMYCVDSTGYMITGWREFSNGKLYYFDPTNGEFRYNTWVNVSTGAYYLQSDGSLAQAPKGSTKNIVTSVGTYTIDENGKAIAKVA